MVLKRVIIRGLELSLNSDKDITNLYEDTKLVYGRRYSHPTLINDYVTHYNISIEHAKANIERFGDHIKSGDIIRFGK